MDGIRIIVILIFSYLYIILGIDRSRIKKIGIAIPKIKYMLIMGIGYPIFLVSDTKNVESGVSIDT